MKDLNSPSTLQKETGTTLVEYALMLALIAAICIGAMFTMDDVTGHLGTVENMSVTP